MILKQVFQQQLLNIWICSDNICLVSLLLVVITPAQHTT